MKVIKKIAILGSTGSIGTQALNIIRENPGLYSVEVLVANNNIDLLAKQAMEFEPNMVVIADESKYSELSQKLKNLPIKVFAGDESVAQSAATGDVDIVLTAMVGFSGLMPTIKAIEAGKRIALANKETLVVAGKLIIDNLKNSKAHIIPVDSEHSAIFQCLTGEKYQNVDNLILTASGGPFRGKDKKYLESVSPEQALDHPNWEMGNKISIDSASMMNKGLEVIEAHWLFGIKPQNIKVIVHPQSVIHSMVEFIDGSIIAQMGVPDMKIPIQYAFDFPDRTYSKSNRFSFLDYPQLDFEKPDIKTFKCLQLAYDVLKTGGNSPCILNAANEVAVDLFLKNAIRFTDIPCIIETTLEKSEIINNPDLTDYFESDNIARKIAFETFKKIRK